MNNIKIGDIVRYYNGDYGIVEKIINANINVHIHMIYVRFFAKPNELYPFYMDNSMIMHWTKMNQ